MGILAFRLDSSTTIGSGHMQRCVTLANYLKKLSIKSVFICKKQKVNFNYIALEAGFKVIEIPPDLNESEDAKSTLKILKTHDIHTLIVDHYKLSYKFENILYSDKIKIFAIDDFTNRKHICHGLLNQNYITNLKKLYQKKDFKKSKLFLGPKYALIRSEFYSEKKQTAKKLKNILVFFGGADSTGETLRFLKETKNLDLKPYAINVIVSTKNKYIKQIKKIKFNKNIQLHYSPKNIAELMVKSDFYFGSGGTITWERIATNLNGVIVSVAKNQNKIAEDLSKDKYDLYMGECKKVDYKDLSLILKLAQQYKLKNNKPIKPSKKSLNSLLVYLKNLTS